MLSNVEGVPADEPVARAERALALLAGEFATWMEEEGERLDQARNAVKAAGLVDTLEGAGPFTVLAPTNEAFAALPKGTVDTLLKPENKDMLVGILTIAEAGERREPFRVRQTLELFGIGRGGGRVHPPVHPWLGDDAAA